ncbi:hypothetical protein COB57_01545 [Candidatus Peregrinibacteria bacterium]|nr:MAG: hypothetical protein COB57_01545 [Candidatus Peregrinibacteria bacterium]
MNLEKINTLPVLNSNKNLPDVMGDIQSQFKDLVLYNMLQVNMLKHPRERFDLLNPSYGSMSVESIFEYEGDMKNCLKKIDSFSAEELKMQEKKMKNRQISRIQFLVILGLAGILQAPHGGPFLLQSIVLSLWLSMTIPPILFWNFADSEKAKERRNITEVLGLENGLAGLEYHDDYNLFEKDPKLLCQFIEKDLDKILNTHKEPINKNIIKLEEELQELEDRTMEVLFLVEKGAENIPHESDVYEEAIKKNIKKAKAFLKEIDEFRVSAKKVRLILKHAMNESRDIKEVIAEFKQHFSHIDIILIQNDIEMEVREAIIGSVSNDFLGLFQQSQDCIEAERELGIEENNQ